MIKIFHIAGRRTNGEPFEMIIVDPEKDTNIRDYIPHHCDVDLEQEISLEGKWQSMPSDAVFYKDV